MITDLRLTGRVVAVSPHLDDAVLSVGGILAQAAWQGATVVVLTVFAGDPTSAAPAGRWDAAGGFRTEGEAATGRRAEDARACELLGARAVWLPFGERHYERRGADEAIREVLAEHVSAADVVLLPGSPLVHPDHALVARLGLSVDPGSAQVALYHEQPYASRFWERRQAKHRRNVSGVTLPDLPPFERVRLGARARWAKWRAVGAYSSQLRLLHPGPGRVLLRLSREALAWLPERYRGRSG